MKEIRYAGEPIRSRNNQYIVRFSKLTEKKYRESERCFLCEGEKLFLEAAEHGGISYLFLREDYRPNDGTVDRINALSDGGTKVFCVGRDAFDKLSTERSPEGVIAVVPMDCVAVRRDPTDPDYGNERILILESVRDPGNLGTVIRTAAAFGFDRLILSSDCADLFSNRVARGAMGALFKVSFDVFTDLGQPIFALQKEGRRVLACALHRDALTLGKDPVSSSDVCVIGNEGHGISDRLIACADASLVVPMRENTESLNASVCASVVMWEIAKNDLFSAKN